MHLENVPLLTYWQAYRRRNGSNYYCANGFGRLELAVAAASGAETLNVSYGGVEARMVATTAVAVAANSHTHYYCCPSLGARAFALRREASG